MRLDGIRRPTTPRRLRESRSTDRDLPTIASTSRGRRRRGCGGVRRARRCRRGPPGSTSVGSPLLSTHRRARSLRSRARRVLKHWSWSTRTAAGDGAGAGAYRERLRELLRLADVVNASEEDLACLDPDRTPHETARGLLERGPSLVLLTRGSRGATVFTMGCEAMIEAPDVEVIDTVGAGDAFGAAWLGAWVADGLGCPELGDFEAVVRRTAEFAALVAARTCARAGAEPPRAAKVDAEWCFA